MNNWRLAEVWNAATLAREERPNTPRNYMWASELGKGVADVILRMRGEEPTNPPNARSRRKFEAGNIFEWIVRLVLLRSGILTNSQERVVHQYEGLLEVTGKLDFEAGGVPNYDAALDSLGVIELPDVINRGTTALLEYLKEKYPNGLENKLIEVKSTSAYMFDAMERTGKASRNHRLQLTHYLKAKGYESGVIIYICRDDLRMLEIEVFLDAENEAEYRKEIEEMTRVYNSGEMPPLEPRVIYDEDTERFSKNWQIAYSMYLTKLYGIKDQAEFDDTYGPVALRWNNVLNRMRTAAARQRWLDGANLKEESVQYEKIEGKRTKKHFVEIDGNKIYIPEHLTKSYEMTDKNLEAIREMQAEGFAPYELANRMKDPAPDEDEATNQDYLATDI